MHIQALVATFLVALLILDIPLTKSAVTTWRSTDLVHHRERDVDASHGGSPLHSSVKLAPGSVHLHSSVVHKESTKNRSRRRGAPPVVPAARVDPSAADAILRDMYASQQLEDLNDKPPPPPSPMLTPAQMVVNSLLATTEIPASELSSSSDDMSNAKAALDKAMAITYVNSLMSEKAVRDAKAQSAQVEEQYHRHKVRSEYLSKLTNEMTSRLRHSADGELGNQNGTETTADTSPLSDTTTMPDSVTNDDAIEDNETLSGAASKHQSNLHNAVLVLALIVMFGAC
ncbi:hypothetical protein CYMTET_46827 [Cymbomonas tetramitiformis]|uniref:Uncharacterized protein n=1 Tax=Cymbomonas tetramitiformis TaxID=36881 RepID=A0AAE0BVE0_9CHLO|nr:hypothetical protein CYMTET_46827 [Cymbomonas tetramitiformis]